MLHQNIQSICKNFDLFVLKLQCLKNLPKITILSEIWIEDEEIPFYSLLGYNAYPKCNADYRAGGVIICVANCLSCRRIGKIQITTADYVHLEIVFCKTFSFDIIGMYRLLEYSEIIFTDDLSRLLNTVKNRILM